MQYPHQHARVTANHVATPGIVESNGGMKVALGIGGIRRKVGVEVVKALQWEYDGHLGTYFGMQCQGGKWK